jgi:hypothetical protein
VVRRLEFRDGGFEFRRNRVADSFLDENLLKQVRFAGFHEINQFGLKVFDLFHRHVVEEIVLHRPQHRSLHFDGHRLVLCLFEQFDDAFAAFEQSLRLGVEIRANCAKAASSRNCARSPLIRPATCFMALICAAEPTRETDRPTEMAGRTP